MLRWGALLLVVGGVLLIAAGCGGSEEAGSASPQQPTTAAPATTTAAVSTTDIFEASCAVELQPLADTLGDLDSRLSVGLNFEAYSQRVGDGRVSYDKVDFDSLDPACIAGPGVQLEKALNSYTKAYNVWNTCVSDIDCSNDSIKPLLQKHWARATRQIKNARVMLRVG